MGSVPVIRLTSPCSLRHRGLAVRLVAEACRLVRGDGSGDEQTLAFDLQDPFDAELVSAFAEIYNNIVLHAYNRREGESVEITIMIDGALMIVEIRDNGVAFDMSAVPEPDLDSLPEGGMGLHIARAMLDEVAYEPGPPNLWRLVKRHLPSLPRDLPTNR
jgi:serine/threonine-protein kinase RsbW